MNVRSVTAHPRNKQNCRQHHFFSNIILKTLLLALPPALHRTPGDALVFRFEPQKGDTAGPLFGGWLLPVTAGS